jgi:hypothetical protein
MVGVLRCKNQFRQYLLSNWVLNQCRSNKKPEKQIFNQEFSVSNVQATVFHLQTRDRNFRHHPVLCIFLASRNIINPPNSCRPLQFTSMSAPSGDEPGPGEEEENDLLCLLDDELQQLTDSNSNDNKSSNNDVDAASNKDSHQMVSLLW